MVKILRFVTSNVSKCMGRIAIQFYRFASKRHSFRVLLNHVPLSMLKIGGNIAGSSLESSFIDNPSQGTIGLIVQSGSMKTILLNQLAKEGLGLSRLIYYYDRMNRGCDESEFIEELAQDPRTRVILFCTESISKGRRFIIASSKVTASKPIVVFKSGRSEVAARAVSSHVGSLAGSDAIYNAAFRQSGCLRVDTIEELIDSAKALSFQQPAKGKKVGILTNGGGAGIVAADACLNKGLEVPALSQSIRECFKKEIPLFSGVTNPLDLKVLATAEVYANAIDCLLTSDEVDLIILMVYPTPALDVDKFVGLILKLQRKFTKPLVICGSGSDKFIDRLRALESSNIPVYILPERAVSGASALAYFGRVQEKIK